MVDEYQDTNTIQERLLFLLAGDQNNLCVVGDDDQGLLPFSGCDHPQHSGISVELPAWGMHARTVDYKLPLDAGNYKFL